MAVDPFTLTYNALWDILESHKAFSRLVKIGNRQKFTSQNQKKFKEVLAADRPMVGVVPTKDIPHLSATSSTSKITAGYQIVLVTGSLLLDEQLYPVCWEIFLAMSKWQPKLTALRWNSKQFINLARPTDLGSGLGDPDTHGIDGWVARWDYEVHMHFTTTDLQA